MAPQPAPAPAQTWQQPAPAMSPPAPSAPNLADPAQNPMATHLKVVAVLEIVWGALAAIGAVVVLFVFTVGSAVLRDARNQGAPTWLSGAAAGLGLILAAIIGTLAVLALLGGTRLLKMRRSGKVLTYVVAALSLLNLPIGTAYGIYAFVILSNAKTDALLVNP